MDVFLLADIGGTNARFAFYNRDTNAQILVKVYKVAEYETLEDALGVFLKDGAGALSITAAAFAVAGMVLSDVVALTNCPWIFRKDRVAALLKTDRVHVFNDFAAIALALNVLSKDNLKTLQEGLPNAIFPKVVMGPGTGLGVAALRTEVGSLIPFPTEAGHMRYAANAQHERDLLHSIEDFCGGFISAEHLVSGPGLVTLYKAECALARQTPENYEPSDVVDQARKGDTLCRSVLNDFASIFGPLLRTLRSNGCRLAVSI